MYIVGHCVIAALARIPGMNPFGEDCVGLMLPDMIRCHDWGYGRCFQPRSDSPTERLLRAHLLGDWFVHYGAGGTRRRCGWAYRNMAPYARAYDTFFATAAQRGLLISWSRDSRRGFAHTMAEYSIDIWLCRRGLFDGHLEPVRAALAGVGRADGRFTLDWFHRTIAQEGIESGSENMAADIACFRDRAARARTAEEFVHRAGVRKFGLVDCEDSLALMAETLDEGLTRISETAFHGAVEGSTAFLKRHLPTKALAWT